MPRALNLRGIGQTDKLAAVMCEIQVVLAQRILDPIGHPDEGWSVYIIAQRLARCRRHNRIQRKPCRRRRESCVRGYGKDHRPNKGEAGQRGRIAHSYVPRFSVLTTERRPLHCSGRSFCRLPTALSSISVYADASVLNGCDAEITSVG